MIACCLDMRYKFSLHVRPLNYGLELTVLDLWVSVLTLLYHRSTAYMSYHCCIRYWNPYYDLVTFNRRTPVIALPVNYDQDHTALDIHVRIPVLVLLVRPINSDLYLITVGLWIQVSTLLRWTCEFPYWSYYILDFLY